MRSSVVTVLHGHVQLPAAPLEIARLINSLPPDVNKKLSLHDLKRIADNYNTGPCPNCHGGHFRPCQWCGETGMVTMEPNKRPAAIQSYQQKHRCPNCGCEFAEAILSSREN